MKLLLASSSFTSFLFLEAVNPDPLPAALLLMSQYVLLKHALFSARYRREAMLSAMFVILAVSRLNESFRFLDATHRLQM